jgi:outer membrane protein TolC
MERLRSAQVQDQEDKIQIEEARNDLAELTLNLSLNLNEYKRMRSMLKQMIGGEVEINLSDPVLNEIVIDKKINTDANSDLKILNSKISLMESDLTMKKSEFYPEFSLKAKLNKSYSPMIEDSKEIMFGITLPFLFWGQQSNGVDSARFKIEAMKHARINQLTALKSKSEVLQSEIEDLVSNLKFLKESSLSLKEKKMKLLINYSYTEMKTLMKYKLSVDDVYMIKMKILEKEIELQKKYFEWTELEG